MALRLLTIVYKIHATPPGTSLGAAAAGAADFERLLETKPATLLKLYGAYVDSANFENLQADIETSCVNNASANP